MLAHDVAILGVRREHGTDVNAELRFVSPAPDSWLADVSAPWRRVPAPRADIGIDVNTNGCTSQVWFGLIWTAVLWQGVFAPRDHVDADFGFGPAFNNGHTSSCTHASLASNVLFHPSVELVCWFTRRATVSVYYQHRSTAGLVRQNVGLNSLGVRLGLAF